MADSDALRASLDNFEVDRKAGRDRDYVESVLRRIEAAERVPVKPSDDPKESAPEPAKATHTPDDATPAFSPVIAIQHPAKVKDGDVVEMEADQPMDEVEFKEVLFKEVSKDDEPEDDVERPDPKAGYMKGEYALFRRQMDSDHAAYFFSTELVDDAEQARVPPGYEVRLTEETELPYIARRGKAAHLNQSELVRAQDREDALDIAVERGIGGLQGE